MDSNEGRKGLPWEEWEYELLRAEYSQGGAVPLKPKLQRPVTAISMKAALEGIRFDPEKAKQAGYYRRRARNNNNWTANEKAIVERSYEEGKGPQEAVERLEVNGTPRTYHAVIAMAGTLGKRRGVPQTRPLTVEERQQLLCGQHSPKTTRVFVKILRAAVQVLVTGQRSVLWRALPKVGPKSHNGVLYQLQAKCERCKDYQQCQFWERHKGYWILKFPQQDLALIKWGKAKGRQGVVAYRKHVWELQVEIEISQLVRKMNFRSNKVIHWIMVGAVVHWMAVKQEGKYDHLEALDIHGYQEDLAYEGWRVTDQAVVERVLYLIEVKTGLGPGEAQKGYAQLERYAAQYDRDAYTQVLQILVLPVHPEIIGIVPPNVLILTWHDMGFRVERLLRLLQFFVEFEED